MAESHDILSLLSSSNRDYLLRNNGDQVEINSLKGKKVGLYFSASWCGPCQHFTPKLMEAYNELPPKGNFEIVFVSADKDDESFNGYFSKMPWVAVPFSDYDTRSHLDELFKVKGIPYLVIIGETGKLLTDGGVQLIREYGADGYPFTPERINELKEQEEEAKKNQSLISLLLTPLRDFVISPDGKKVPVTELEGKTVGLYFSLSSYDKCVDFTQKLTRVYEELKARGENFEIVMIPLGDNEIMQWFSLPWKDRKIEKLARYFELSSLPTLVIIGPDGKTLHTNVADAIEEHGSLAYPFTSEKFLVLEEIERTKREAQTLESVLVSKDLNFVIGKNGLKVPVSDLVGKTILLYFSAHWCRPCRAFTPKLIEVYHNIKAKDDEFEVIFISRDADQSSFDDYFSGMPWLALPFGDKRKDSLSRLFKVQGIPSLPVIGKTGKTMIPDARDLVMLHGDSVYPFTEEHLKEIEEGYVEMAKGWPEKVKHALHEKHELVLTRFGVYTCDGCKEKGYVWTFRCQACDFDLHPKCALGEDKGNKNDGEEEEKPKEGWVCDGNVCHRA